MCVSSPTKSMNAGLRKQYFWARERTQGGTVADHKSVCLRGMGGVAKAVEEAAEPPAMSKEVLVAPAAPEAAAAAAAAVAAMAAPLSIAAKIFSQSS